MAFQLIRDVKLNQDFRGHAELCEHTFTINWPDQLGASWFAQNHVNAMVEELSNQGSILLEYRLWEDKMSGTWTTDYKCQVTASASPLFWQAIIFAVFILLSLAAVAYIITKIEDITSYFPKPALALFPVALLLFGGALLIKELKA
jgi:hypothetical protein